MALQSQGVHMNTTELNKTRIDTTRSSIAMSALDTNGNGTIEIMPLGDSITRGEDATTPIALQNGYRDNLETLLEETLFNNADINFDFVGSLVHGEGFDNNHEGHGGRTIEFLLDNIDRWLATNPPEVVLLKAGTNDMGFFEARSPEDAIAQLDILIEKILTQSPAASVMVSSIAPANPDRLADSIYARSVLPTFDSRVDAFNTLLPNLVNDKANQGKPVSFIDAGRQLDADVDLSVDGLHPNSSGYEKIAIAFQSGIQDLLAAQPQQPSNSIVGTDSDDWLGGTTSQDSIFGLAGSDVLYGFDGSDQLEGGDNNDNLYGAAGNDTLDGGSGDDFLDGGRDDDRLNGGAGNDLILGRTGDDSLEGRNGDDTLSGGEGEDRLNGGSGDDALDGGDGNDLFKGGSGRDRLYGVGGNDFLEGGSGNDRLLGGSGNDNLKGTEEVSITAQVDILDGGSGNDLYIVQTASQAAYTAAGSSDYALIRSFDPTVDRIALGSDSYQLLDTGDTNGQAGIFDSRQELIGIVESYRASDLNINDPQVFLKNYAL